MAELRSVDPTSLRPNPDNPRRTPAPKAMDDQLVASVRAIGLIQPPIVRDVDGTLVTIAGNRRVKAAIAAGFTTIDVLVCDADDATDAMRAVSENLIRASMNSVDVWRATQALEAKGWNEQAIADALAQPVRTVRRLKLLAHLHPPMLDCMAGGSMPNEAQLRTIAAATLEEQAQVWKKHRPKKGHEVLWWEVSQALEKRRMPASAAKFDADLAKAYGVVWEDDLFAPAGEDSRYTTNVDGFFGAQQEWLANHLPERGSLLPTNEYGRGELPKKAERVYGKPGKQDVTGHYIDPHSGAINTIAYRLPAPKKPAKADKNAGSSSAPDGDEAPARARPDVTQMGNGLIGGMRTDALHQALREAPIDDSTLLALLVLALDANNVSVQTYGGLDRFDRHEVAQRISEGGILTADLDNLRTAARAMLTAVLSCADNATNSGPAARITGEAIGAALFLPTMATDEFLSCLSRGALEATAKVEGVKIGARVKDTRANFVQHFAGATYLYPPALFKITPEEVETARTTRRGIWVPGTGQTPPDDADDGGETDGASEETDQGGPNETGLAEAAD